MVPHLIPPDARLTLTLYRLAHRCIFSTQEDVFGWSVSVYDNTFNCVCRVLVAHMYDHCVTMPATKNEWIEEIKGFIENYEFPCVGASDGFHVYINSKLKSYFSFKKRYSITKMGLAGYHKHFLNSAVEAPGSTHDS